MVVVVSRVVVVVSRVVVVVRDAVVSRQGRHLDAVQGADPEGLYPPPLDECSFVERAHQSGTV